MRENNDKTLLLSDDNEHWYEGLVHCKKADCEHRFADCYGYVWYTNEQYENKVAGISARLASKTVRELTSINRIVSSLTLADVLDPVPSILKSLSDTSVSELGTAINSMYLGELLGYKRTLDCKQTHEHTDDCYGWYEASCGDDSHAHTDDCYDKPAEGLLAKFANKRINQLNTLGDAVKELTLADVLDPVPSMLADLADTRIDELGNKLNDMYVGSAMGYVRNEKDGTQYPDESTADGEVKSNGSAFVKTYNGKWYEAELTCNDNHTHPAACYEYVWYTDATCTEKTHGASKKAFLQLHIERHIQCDKRAYSCEIGHKYRRKQDIGQRKGRKDYGYRGQNKQPENGRGIGIRRLYRQTVMRQRVPRAQRRLLRLVGRMRQNGLQPRTTPYIRRQELRQGKGTQRKNRR